MQRWILDTIHSLNPRKTSTSKELRLRTRCLVVGLLFAVFACGDGGAGPDSPPSITLTASASMTTLPQGGSGSVTLTLVRSKGFAAPVNISVSGLPDGITTTVAPAQFTLTSGQAIVTVNVAELVTPGTYSATITASAAGVGSATTTHAVVVEPRPTFSLTGSGTALSIHQGDSASSNIAVVRTNFSSTVSLALVNPPTGISGSFSPSSVSGSSSSLTITVGMSATPGTYSLTIAGSAPGHADVTTSISVVVSQRPDYALAVTGPLEIYTGGTGQAIVRLLRTNFTGAVTPALANLPAGITGGFAPGVITGDSAVLTFGVTNSVAPGSYPVAISATAPGFTARLASLTIVVTPAPDFNIAVHPLTLTMRAGGIAQLSVTINRTNFTGPVAVALDGPPTGLSATFDPASTTGTSVTVLLRADSTTAVGNYSLSIKGTGTLPGGEVVRKTEMALTMQEYPGGGGGPEPTPPPPQPPPPTPPPNGVGSVAINPSALSVGPGGTVTTTVALQGTIGPVVSFSVLSPPPGIGISFTTPVMQFNYASSTLTLTVAASVAPGTYTMEVQGSSSTLTRSNTLTLTVSAQSSFALSALPTHTAFQGYVTNHAINIVRTNYSGAITLQLATPPPAGVTYTLLPSPTTSNLSVLRLVTAAEVPLGTFPLTVRASASGYPDQTVTVQVTVKQISTFSYSIAPRSHGTYKGGTVVSTISLERINFTDDVTLSFYAPPGLTATLSTNVLSGPTLTSTLTVSVSPTLEGTGGMSVMVTAKSDTILRSQSVTLLVQDKPISYLGLPSTVSIKQGTSGTVTITPDRGFYVGPVELSVTGVPSGISVSFAPNPISGFTSTVATINVGAGVPVGQYVLTFTGSAPGGVPVSAQMTVYVTQ